jgi:hypothetical protein
MGSYEAPGPLPLPSVGNYVENVLWLLAVIAGYLVLVWLLRRHADRLEEEEAQRNDDDSRDG